MPLRLVMMGTGTFAVPTFQALLNSDHDVAALVTQPDRTGPGHHRHDNPLKEMATQSDVAVLQPANAKTPEFLEELRSLQADLFVVAAYGQILSADLLGIPRLGAINLHGSLLPRHRGAAPVQYAVWNGDAQTGVTIFQIEPRLDAGEMLGKVVTNIEPKETSGHLHDRLALLAAPLALDVIDQLEQGTETREPQDPLLVTRSPRLKKEQGEIDWSKPSKDILNHLFAMQPWPMPYTFLHVPDKAPMRLLILDADPSHEEGKRDQAAPAGSLRQTANGELTVRTGDGALCIRTVQPAGKRAMSSGDFLRGTRIESGRFGPNS